MNTYIPAFFVLIFSLLLPGLAHAHVGHGPDFAPIENDALVEPRTDISSDAVGGAPPLAESRPYNAGFYETSEFMTGSVLVNIILPESDGSIDANTYNWTSTQEANILSEIQDGMDWWASNVSQSNLTFQYNLISGRTDARARTGYEPITRPGWQFAGGQDVWINQIMDKFGYTSGDYFFKTRSQLNDAINSAGTQWGVTVFVVNDGGVSQSFTDGSFAYSYFGGPFFMMTYDNNGYGIGNMDAVAAHEIGHTFYALDQYYSAFADCSRRAGYLNALNYNSLYNQAGGNCPSNVGSIMRGGVSPYTLNQVDQYALAQVGLTDSDSDNIPDILDTSPKVTLNSKTGSATVTYTGVAEVQPVANQNSYANTLHAGQPVKNISTNTIASVQYRVDGGAWQNAHPIDLAYNEGIEEFEFTLSGLSDGYHAIDVRAKNSVNNYSTLATSNARVVGKMIVTGTGEGGGPQVRFFDHAGQLVDPGFFAFDQNLRTGVRVAAGDVDGDGSDELITALGPGGEPLVRVYESDGTLRSEFEAYPSQFRGGVYVASGDLDNDGVDEIVTGVGDGGGPQVRTFNLDGDPIFTPGFFAYGKNFRGGVKVAVGDFNGDGKEEIITGAGPGGGPQVMGYTRYGVRILNFFAYAEHIRTGVNVSAGDANGDGKIDIITGAGPGGGPQIRFFSGKGQPYPSGTQDFFAYASYVRSGVNVATFDFDGDGDVDIITGAGPGGGPQVRKFTGSGKVLFNGFFAYDQAFRGGVNVTAGNFQ